METELHQYIMVKHEEILNCTGLRANLARSQIRNERQRNDTTKAGFGEAPQQAVLRILP